MSWTSITHLGDTAVLVPAALAVSLAIGQRAGLRSTVIWLMAVGGAGFFVLCSKLAFMGWGIGSAMMDFTGFSGHAMFACLVLPVVAWLLAPGASLRWQWAAAVAGVGLGLSVAYSRVHLHYHSLAEVVAGVVLGLVVGVGFLGMTHWRRECSPAAAAVMLCVLMLMAVQHGERTPTQGWLTELAVALSGHRTAYTRADLQAGGL